MEWKTRLDVPFLPEHMTVSRVESSTEIKCDSTVSV
jgi:hypothetical protein